MVNLLSFGALLCLGASVVNAAPADDLASGYQKPSPVQFPKRQLFGGAADPLPTVKLPYGTWRANKYDKEKDIYFFKNIRFAAPPLGNLRWRKPAPPVAVRGVQDGREGRGCIPNAKGIRSIPLASAFADLASVFLGLGTGEDCLFLDVLVPGKVLRGNVKVPVLSWFYGGAYIFGGKDTTPDYSTGGVSLLNSGNNSFIYVASNYRVGAYGFLAGSSIEADGNPNAGLHDQRAALQWIQDFIGLFNGNKDEVTAMGESAGAGSILHHLTANGGTQNPLFKRAILQSPAFEPAPDRRGVLENKYQIMLREAGCAGKGLPCLRRATPQQLEKGYNAVLDVSTNATFGFGPSSDGTFVRQFPALEFMSGNYWKGIDSVIVSHVSKEADIFTPNIKDEADFDRWTGSLLPGFSPSSALVRAIYPPTTPLRDRVNYVVRDSSFICNILPLTEAYAGKAWNLQYSRGLGLHGLDLAANFYSPGLSDALGFGDALFGEFSYSFQSYLTSYVLTGDPNTLAKKSGQVPTVNWPRTTVTPGARYFANTLDAGARGFVVGEDTGLDNQICAKWFELEKLYTNEFGYAPPGASLPATIPAGVNYVPKVVPGSPQASVNFTTPAPGQAARIAASIVAEQEV